MKFISLEDPTGIFEVILFPKIYQQFGHILTDKGPFIVKGKIEDDSGNRTLPALWLGLLTKAPTNHLFGPKSPACLPVVFHRKTKEQTCYLKIEFIPVQHPVYVVL